MTCAEPNLSNQAEDSERKTRIDFYAEQVEKVAARIRQYTRIGLFDGYYAKEKFVRRMVEQGFTVISRLRSDANLQYLYEGEQKLRGRKRKYDGKVDFLDLTKFAETQVKIENKEIELYSKVVWSVSLKRKIKLVNEHLLNLFISKLGLEQSLIKYKETLTELRNYATIFS